MKTQYIKICEMQLKQSLEKFTVLNYITRERSKVNYLNVLTFKKPEK